MSEQARATTMKATAVRMQWSALLNRVFGTKERIIVEKSGIPVAAIIPIDDYLHYRRLEDARARDFAAINRIGEAFKDVPLDELEREVDEAVAEVKREMQAERRARQHSA